MSRIVAFIVLLLAGAAPAAAATQDDLVAQGHAIAEADCARCHAIGPTGDSQLPIAPAFRTLSERYPVKDLEEALAEGIVSGHPEMPEFEFQPEEIDALIAYLQSVQAKQD
jgi:mono/diheme cytochrome c family protein